MSTLKSIRYVQTIRAGLRVVLEGNVLTASTAVNNAKLAIRVESYIQNTIEPIITDSFPLWEVGPEDVNRYMPEVALEKFNAWCCAVKRIAGETIPSEDKRVGTVQFHDMCGRISSLKGALISGMGVDAIEGRGLYVPVCPICGRRMVSTWHQQAYSGLTYLIDSEAEDRLVIDHNEELDTFDSAQTFSCGTCDRNYAAVFTLDEAVNHCSWAPADGEDPIKPIRKDI